MASFADILERKRAALRQDRQTPTPPPISQPVTSQTQVVQKPTQYAVQAYETSAKEGVIWRTKELRGTMAEAEALAKQLQIDLSEPHRAILDKPEERLIIVKTRSERAAEQKAQTLAERSRLYKQSLEKTASYQPLSQAEGRAFQQLKSKPITYSIAGQTIKGTGESLVMRSKLEQIKAKDLAIEKQRQQQRFIDPILPRLKFETAEEARAAGYQAIETKTTQDIFFIPKTGKDLVKLGQPTKTDELKLNLKASGTMNILPKADTKAEALLRKAVFLEETAPKYGGAGQRAAAFGLGILAVPTALLFNPIKTIKGTVSSLINPIGTIKYYGTKFKTTPSATLGEFVGMYLTGKAGGKAVTEITKPFIKPKIVGEPTLFQKIKTKIKKPFKISDKYLEEASGGGGGDYIKPTDSDGFSGGSSGSIEPSKLGKSQFEGIGKSSENPLAGGGRFSQLGEVYSGRQQLKLIYPQQEVINIPPQTEIIFPSITRLKSIAITRLGSKTIPLLGLNILGKSLIGSKINSINKQTVVPFSISQSKLKNIQLNVPIQSTVQTPITITIPKLKVTQTPITDLSVIQSTIQQPATIQETVSIQETITIPTLKTSLKQNLQAKLDLQTKLDLRPKLIILPKTKKSPSILAAPQQPTQQGYHVYIKSKLQKLRKGKYKSKGYSKASKQPLSKNAAKNLLMTTLDKYSNRSGYIKKTTNRAKRDEPLKEFLLFKFRQSKKNPNLFVEKSSFAIDSWQEKQDIPYEAARLRRAGLIKATKRKSNYLKKSTMRFI